MLPLVSSPLERTTSKELKHRGGWRLPSALLRGSVVVVQALCAGLVLAALWLFLRSPAWLDASGDGSGLQLGDSEAPAAAGSLAEPAALVTSAARSGRDTLLLYAFSNTDPEFLRNLLYFVDEAVANDTRADYVIIVQEGPGLQDAPLPELPPHARYVRHANECYDWGTYGWALLRSGLVDTRGYAYFFFVNSSVRGPFLPAYARGRFHWMSAFTSRLNSRVKLVGSTISCEGSPLHGKRNGTWRRNPHVQSYAVATDQVGLRVLLSSRHVFACHRDRWDTIYFSELGASAAILAAGYNLDCLMQRYQGLDWRHRANWDCNGRMTPVGEYACDGVSLDPAEVMFVKVKSYLLDHGVSFSAKAAKLEAWQRQAAAWAPGAFGGLAANDYVAQLHKHKAPRVLEARARGAGCFDFSFYAKENPDLRAAAGSDVRSLWRHYVFYGQFDERPHRWLCEPRYANLSWPSVRA